MSFENAEQAFEEEGPVGSVRRDVFMRHLESPEVQETLKAARALRDSRYGPDGAGRHRS